jgi:hypothetical protein
MNFDRFSRFGFVIGISEEALLAVLREFNVPKLNMQLEEEVRPYLLI